LAHEKDWKVLSLPAIKEDDSNPDDIRKIGEALWPEKHDIAKIEGVKKASLRTYISLYQQRPAPAEGNILLKKWFKKYTLGSKPPAFDTIIQSWDCTFKDAITSDFVVGQVWGKIGVESYLLDMVRGQWSFTETVKQMLLLNEKYPECDQKFVEDKANGSAVIDTLKLEISGIIAITPTESKESRASAISYVVEAGNIYLPEEEAWYEELLDELTAFPNGKHDDMVDALTQALKRLYKGSMTPGLFMIG
jgi:predicted phage terminase large subunit-like protein